MSRPRLCGRYCNAIRACGGAGPLCPHCDACETAMQVWDRVLGDGRDERLARPPAPAPRLGTWRLPLRLELGEDPEDLC